VAVAAAVPALWIAPDWIGSGDPFHASRVASSIEPSGAQPALAALVRAVGITPAPLALGALAGFALARRAHDRRVVELSVLAAGWVALLVGLMFAGYPGLGRFFVLPAALICVLGAVGAVRAVRLVAAGRRRAARVRVTGLDLDPATRAGTWRLLLPDRTGCRAANRAA
jgi:peptidoglycan/LPS O-acetylase OafA/YrhL